jgi:CHAT domain-containing protein
VRALVPLLAIACSGADAADPVPPSSGSTAEVLWSLGDSIYWAGAHDSARIVWTRALDAARATGDSVVIARSLTSLGMAYRQLGQYEAARRNGEAALALKLRLSPPPDLFTSYNALGLLAWNEGRLAAASALFASAGRIARAAGDPEQLTKVANNLALVRTEEGEFAAARDGFAEALTAARAAGIPRLEGNALTNAAMLDIRLENPGRAVRSLQLARERYRSVGYVAGEVSALGQLGVALQATGDFPAAFAALDSALELARAHDLRQEEASNLEALADAHLAAGDRRRALGLLREADAIDRALGLVVELGSNLRQTALIYADLGENAAAMRQAAAALDVHRRSGARMEELEDMLLLADLERPADPSGAGHRLDAAATLARALDIRSARVEVALARAQHDLAAGRPRAALEVLREGAPDLASGGYDAAWRGADLRAAVWFDLGRLDSAAAAGRDAVAGLERMRGSVGSAGLRATFLARQSGTYIRLVDILTRSGRIEEALVVADAIRGRVLLDHLLADPDSPGSVRAGGGADAILERLGVLAARADSLDAEPKEPGDTTALAVRTAARAELTRARTAFETEAARRGAGEGLPDALASRLDVRALQRVLHQGEAVLEFLVRPDRVDLFTVTRDAVRHVASNVTARSLRMRVRLAREILADSSAARDRALDALSGLHALLVAPAEQAGHLRGVSSLTLVPHDALAYLPFAALVNSSSGRYLIQDYTLRLGGSGAVLTAQRTRAPAVSRAGTALALAPYPDELPGSRAEVLAIRRARARTQEWVGSAATERRFRAAVGATDIAHLATHATLNPANPLFSRLDLYPRAGAPPDDDGRLEVHEVLGMRLSASLVFLSGCETGVGAAWSSPFNPGEDYTTLMQAFLQAGAGAVVGTLWRVRDDGAAALAEAFYRRLPGASPAESLADAQRALISSPQWERPYHWAGYAVAGD